MGEPQSSPPPLLMLPPGDEGATARYLFLGASRQVAFVDRTIERLWGVSAPELRADPRLWLGRIHPDDRQRVAQALDSESGTTWELEYRVVRDDASVVWVQDGGRALLAGRARQISGRVVDVTRAHVLEDRLRFQAQLLDAVGEAVMAVDPAGTITAWNPAAAELYGWSAHEAVGRQLTELLVKGGRQHEVRRLLASTFARRDSWSGELSMRHSNGLDVPARVTMSPLTGAGDDVVGVAVAAFDLSASHEAEARLRASEEEQRRLVGELRRLTAHLHVVREQEQTRIAREIHDELGQMLTGLKLDVAWMRRRAGTNGNGHELAIEQLRERLAGVAQLVDQTLDAVRHIAGQLRPPALDDLGLETAIRWLVDEFRTRTGIACELHVRLANLPRDEARDTAAFRILQEALTNVARHAEPTRVMVRVVHGGGILSIELTDDGKGVPRAALHASGSLGILGMRERARACGGELTVRRLPRGGTQVRARLPITSTAGASTAGAAAEAAASATAEKEAS